MVSATLRTLAFICGVTLALPQCWCCAVIEQTIAKTEVNTNGNRSTCDSHGCCPMDSKLPSKHTGDVPIPDQPCPCAERTATVTSVFNSGDLALELVVASIDMFSKPRIPTSTATVSLNDTTDLSQPSLNVLYCRWLC